MPQNITADNVLRNEYQKSVANYWNQEKNPVNLLLGDVDGYYHHHYGIGDVDWSVLEAPEGERDDRIIRELHRLEHAQAAFLLDHLGDVKPDDRVMDGGSGRGGTSFMVNERFGCQVDGVSISESQVEFANDQAAQRGVTEKVKFHFRNMLDTGFETGAMRSIWTNETTMYVDCSSCSPSLHACCRMVVATPASRVATTTLRGGARGRSAKSMPITSVTSIRAVNISRHWQRTTSSRLPSPT